MRAIVTLVVLAAAFVAFIWLIQRQLIYLPSEFVPAPPPGVERVSFSTEDDLELSAWFLQPPGESSATVIVFNGNAGNRSNRLPLAAALNREGYSVLLVDYRGYGGNPGSPTEEGLAKDARASLAHLKGREEVDTERIVYFGESLGAAVATSLAFEAPPAALVLRSPFPSLVDVARLHYPFLPVSVLLRDRFPVADRISEVSVPVMVVAGTEDEIVPPELSVKVFEAAMEPKAMFTIEGAGHNDPELLAGRQLIDGIAAFVGSELP